MISSVLKDLLLHLDKGIAELLSSLRRSLAASNIMFPSCSIGFRSVCGPGGGVRSFIHQEVSAYSSCMSSGIVMHRWKPTAPVQCLTLDLALHSLPMPNSVTGNMTFSKASPGPVQADISAADGLGTYGPAQLSSVLLGARWETQQT